MTQKLVTIVTGCYNEVENVRPLYEALQAIFTTRPQYRFEILYIDNASQDGTQHILRAIAAEDSSVKVILNARNFGHIRSPMHGLMEARGDALIIMASDFQDPPEMITQFLDQWEAGHKVVMGVKEKSEESWLFYQLREQYYRMLARMSDVKLVNQTTGFGLYDRVVVEAIRKIDDPYPYFRGLIADVGFEPARVPFTQPRRARGISSQNWYSLYDIAFLGIVNHSKIPLRIATILGFCLACLSMLTATGYLIYKLLYWDSFSVGVAPVLIGFFLLSSVQLVFIGIVGEYIGSIWTQVRHHPYVTEKERINF
ncbi:MAG: glycosyltransferase family 2 protein [Gemmatimonadetes bacterium]|nr:glycosyltransferase family 2 protein [Gemmatimonadota bacterium]